MKNAVNEPSQLKPDNSKQAEKPLNEEAKGKIDEINEKIKTAPRLKMDMPTTRAGGVYIPPWKMEKIANEMKEKDKSSQDYQKYMWENLRKSINGLINKVNVSNIQNIILELFNENLIRGKGLLTRAIFKAQMASPNFTHVYAALVAVVNTKLPDVVRLLIGRYIIQFQKAYKRNNKIV